MAEYIKREALDKALTVAAANDKDKNRRTWAKAICVLHDLPAADVVPVVRCKDCEHLVNTTINANGFLICDISDMEIAPDDFCSYGEPKEGTC